MQAPMITTTTTLPCVASCVTAAATATAVVVGGMGEHAMLSRRFDNSENAAMVDKVKGQNSADGDADVDGVVVVKVGLKIGRKMVVKRGNSSKLLSFFSPFFSKRSKKKKIFFLKIVWFFFLETSTTATTMSGSSPAGDEDDDDDEDEDDADGYDKYDGGVKLARSNTVNDNDNENTAMEKEADAKNTILLRGMSYYKTFFPLFSLLFCLSLSLSMCVCVCIMF